MNLFVTGAWDLSEENVAMLEKMGHSVIFMKQEKEELPCAYHWVEGVICNGLFLHHQIEKFSNLKYIQLTSAGLDRVPVDYIKEHAIKIYNAGGVYSIPMAEFAVAGVLQIYKQSAFFKEKQKRHLWEKHRGLLELYGKIVTIVGCGSVGTECAKRFQSFGCKVVGIDLCSKEDNNFSAIVELPSLDDILPMTDVLILTLPLTKMTVHLINEDYLNKLKRGAVLVNISRGAVVDTEALINKLDDLGGVVLDVFEEEPLREDSPLWNTKNVIVTPHNSFVGDGNQKRLTDIIFKNLKGINR